MAFVSVLTLNPCIDRCIYLPGKLTPGTIHRATRTVQDIAGKGLNQGVVMKHLGCEVEYYSFGSREHDAVDDYIESLGLIYKKTPAACGIRCNVKIVDADGQGTEINEKGGPIQKSETEQILEALEGSDAPIVSVCGSIPQGIEADIYRKIIEKAKEKGRITVLDADGEALKCGISACPDLIKPNRRELAGLYDLRESDLADENKVISLARQVYERYGTTVLCTLDESGSIYVGAEGIFRAGVAKLPLLGFSGAGDTYLGAYIYAKFKQKKTAPEAISFAARASAAKIALPGSLLPTKEQIDAVGEVEVWQV